MNIFAALQSVKEFACDHMITLGMNGVNITFQPEKVCILHNEAISQDMLCC